ncbi:FAD-dependent oxidoreductase [Desulfogranum marinum]|uniref:FAD/NAD(P)-dependent oxidoreductase n=1 Tax=Desulfogranum marinum TaxID=453220 RepID=UPI0029C6D44D|nr:FAD-dependent oxidoreductase [Desulfogranum marinum]
MKNNYHVVIIGGGAGGLATAETLLGHGLDILLIDENVHTGGQLLRKVKRKYSSSPLATFDPDRIKNKGFGLVERVLGAGNGIDIINRAQVLGISADRKIMVEQSLNSGTAKDSNNQIFEVQAEYIVLATGVRERYLPFQGWTLPGVMSLGAAQILMKSHGVLPGASTLIGGSSPLMMVLAAEILKNGGKVPVLLDENGFQEKALFLPHIKDHWSKLIEGAWYTAKMMIHRVPLRQNMRIIEARGDECLQSVVAAKTDREGNMIPNTEREYRVDTLAVGYGFVPNIELAVQAGCDVCYRKDQGGWIVKVNDMLETSQSALYAVGEITGVAGAKKSLVEGKLAAMSILEKMDLAGASSDKEAFQQEKQQLVKLDQKQQEYACFLGQFCDLPIAAYKAIPDATIICRCENITMGAIRKGVESGFDTLAGLKKATRCTMGRCQGRICGAVITDIVTALTEKPADEIGVPGARMPVKNVELNSFVQ